MALLGDTAAVEEVLSSVARSYAGRSVSSSSERGEREDALVVLLGLARAAIAARLSRGGSRTTTGRSSARASEASVHVSRGSESAAARSRRQLAELRPTEREAVVLFLVGGLDVERVARACSTDVTTARARIERALGALTQPTDATAKGDA
jgi:DNA-directed RNA polymerase specialized sigma24 family protein